MFTQISTEYVQGAATAVDTRRKEATRLARFRVCPMQVLGAYEKACEPKRLALLPYDQTDSTGTRGSPKRWQAGVRQAFAKAGIEPPE